MTKHTRVHANTDRLEDVYKAALAVSALAYTELTYLAAREAVKLTEALANGKSTDVALRESRYTANTVRESCADESDQHTFTKKLREFVRLADAYHEAYKAADPVRATRVRPEDA